MILHFAFIVIRLDLSLFFRFRCIHLIIGDLSLVLFVLDEMTEVCRQSAAHLDHHPQSQLLALELDEAGVLVDFI